MPLAPGGLLGEPPLPLAPLPLAPLRLVPLDVPDAPLEPAGPQSMALLPPDAELERLAPVALEPLELLGEFIAVLPGGQAVELPLGLFMLGLLGLVVPLVPDCWASAVPPKSTTAAAAPSRAVTSRFVNCIGRLLLWRCQFAAKIFITQR